MAKKIYDTDKIWEIQKSNKNTEEDFTLQLKKLTQRYGVSTEIEDKKEAERLRPIVNSLINNNE